MAAPYVVLSAMPGLIARIPKPGPWMETLRQVLAFPMLGAVVWMLWVLEILSGQQAMPVLLSMLLAAGLGAWIYGRWGKVSSPTRSRIVAGVLAVILVVGGAAAAIRTAGASAPAQEQTTSSSWEPWSPERQATLVDQGVPVFVDFTARWCLTCQVNERIALENPDVVQRFRQLKVATLRADWTDRNDTIARALNGFGRAGVPLYVLYRPGSASPIILPELLTPAVVLDALSEPD
jgi:thiol:disulfide interchange protein DsbD